MPVIARAPVCHAGRLWVGSCETGRDGQLDMDDSMKSTALIVSFAALVLGGCARSEDANQAASADTVEMPADELPSGDPSAQGGDEADAALAAASDAAAGAADMASDGAADAAQAAAASARDAAEAAKAAAPKAAPKPAN